LTSEEGTTQHNIQQKKAKGQTTIYETLHRKKKKRSSNSNTGTLMNYYYEHIEDTTKLILIHGVDRCTDTLKSGFDG
jgi:hypothetical protein